MKWFFQSPTTPETVMAGSQYCGGSGVGGCRGGGAGRGGSLFSCSCMFYPLPQRHSPGWPSRVSPRREEGSPVWFVGRETARLCEQQGWGPLLCVLPTHQSKVVPTWCCPQNKQGLLVEGLHVPFWERKILPSSPVAIPVTFPRLVFLHTVIYYPACFFICFLVYG